MKIKNPTKSARLVAYGTVAAVGLAVAGFAAPGLALADTAANTSMTLSGSSDAISVTVSTSLPMVVATDGTITGPTATSAQITNNAVFGIHVQTVQAVTETSFHLVKQGDFPTATADNAFWATLTPNSGTAIDLANFATAATPTKGEWDIASGASLNLSSAGKIENVKVSLSSTPLKAATINWMFQSGPAV